MLFGASGWWGAGAQSGRQRLTGLVIGKTRALDNAFVIAMIFTCLAVPWRCPHRVLCGGIPGVIVPCGSMIGLGTTISSQLSRLLNTFAAFMILTGVTVLFVTTINPNIVKDRWHRPTT